MTLTPTEFDRLVRRVALTKVCTNTSLRTAWVNRIRQLITNSLGGGDYTSTRDRASDTATSNLQSITTLLVALLQDQHHFQELSRVCSGGVVDKTHGPKKQKCQGTVTVAHRVRVLFRRF